MPCLFFCNICGCALSDQHEPAQKAVFSQLKSFQVLLLRVPYNLLLLFAQAGIIQLLDQTLFIQPLARHLVSDKNAKVNSHLVYRRSVDHKTMENQYKGTINNSGVAFRIAMQTSLKFRLGYPPYLS